MVLKSGYQARDPSAIDMSLLYRSSSAQTNYHQPSDDLKAAARLWQRPLTWHASTCGYLLEAANGSQRAPRWNAGDFFAEKFGGSL